MDPVILRDYSGSHEQPEELDALLADAATDTDDAAAPQDQVAPEAEEYGLAIRALALLCACCLSVGSHYGSYILGPLKSRLAREVGTSNSQFSLIVSAYSLNSTWTPLIGGLLVTRFGPAIISVFATSFVLVGLLGLLVGLSTHTIWLMILGMFVFGLGTSPLSVAQESIILQFFRFKGRGISLALGLLAGKGASFIAANTSFPLSEQYGPRAPFIVAVMLALFSWAINLVYLTFYNRLVAKSRDRNASLRAAKVVSHIAAKRDFQWRIIPKLGDTFWMHVLFKHVFATLTIRTDISP
jgi:MFS family permease